MDRQGAGDARGTAHGRRRALGALGGLAVVVWGVCSTAAPAAGAGGAPRTAEEELAAGRAAGGKYKAAAIISPDEMWKAVARHKGRVVLLHLWATWCLPCLAELPVIAGFAKDMKGKGVEIVSVSLDDPSEPAAWKVGRVLHERTGGALASPIVRVGDPDGFVSAVDPRWDGVIPALFAFDRAGQKRRAHIGEFSRGHLERMVADLVVAPPKK